MVQRRTSLESLVLQAWRDRWTEIQWSVALKAALAEDNSEIEKLCGLLIKQATLSEVPNKLLFNYLSFTVASQVVSHASLIQAITEYRDFHKELCIGAILGILNFIRERLKCPSSDVYQCQCMCKLLTKLIAWFISALERTIERKKIILVGELITTMMAFVYNPFISVCLYFDELEDAESNQDLRNRAKIILDNSITLDWLSESYKQDLRSFVNRMESTSQLFGAVQPSHPRDPVPQPTVISLAILYGSVFLAEPLEAPIEALKNIREVQQLPWYQVILDFIRGSLLLQQDCTSSVPESHLTAFVYLRIPRIIHELIQRDVLTKSQLLEALTHVANFHSLFNSLDMKARCDCFYFFVSELSKLQLITDGEMSMLREIRSREKSPLTDASPGNQANIILVLKAEPTLQTLLKSFHSEFAQKQDKLVQMMHHMISGKSFEFICAAAAATGRLSTFTGKLIDFNESSKGPQTAGERTEDAVLRSELFDLSFSLLSRIVQLFGCSPISQNPSASGTFFESWCKRYIEIKRQDRRPSLGVTSTSSNTPAPLEHATDRVSPTNTEEAAGDSEVAEQYTEMIRKLKCGQSGWVPNNDGEWNVICDLVPQLGNCLLSELRSDQISHDELKVLFSGLTSITVNGTHWVCSLILCLSQWLVSCSISEERRRLAVSLHTFVDSTFVQGIERTKTDRQTFMSNIAKRLLTPLLASTPVPSPPYPWLHSVRRQVHSQQPLVTGFLLPPLDTMRHYLSGALKQGWMSCSALSIIERCQKLGEQKMWLRIWFDELSKLSATDELNLWCDICMSCCYVDPAATLTNFVEMLAVFVLEPGRELFCVAPRGASLSRLLVRLYLFGFRAIASECSPSATGIASLDERAATSNEDEPKEKLRKIDSVTDSTGPPDWEKFRDSLSNALANLYRRFCSICNDGDLRPAVFFVGSFLKYLAEYRTPEARRMMSQLPCQLIELLVRTDPQILSAPIVLALTDLNDKNQRLRALQNLCLLRHLKAL